MTDQNTILPRQELLIGRTSRGAPVTIEVEIASCTKGPGKLSICGQVWRVSLMDVEMFGQCLESLGGEIETYTEGSSPELLDRIVKVWRAWHLNNMRPGCSHQTAAKWGERELSIYTYQLTTEGLHQQQAVLRDAKKLLLVGETVCLTDGEIELAKLEWRVSTDGDAERLDYPELYELKSTEKKRANWVTEKEHPEGVLSKPCPECGYRYGSKWLTEELPEAIAKEVHGWADSLVQMDGNGRRVETC